MSSCEGTPSWGLSRREPHFRRPHKRNCNDAKCNIQQHHQQQQGFEIVLFCLPSPCSARTGRNSASRAPSSAPIAPPGPFGGVPARPPAQAGASRGASPPGTRRGRTRRCSGGPGRGAPPPRRRYSGPWQGFLDRGQDPGAQLYACLLGGCGDEMRVAAVRARNADSGWPAAGTEREPLREVGRPGSRGEYGAIEKSWQSVGSEQPPTRRARPKVLRGPRGLPLQELERLRIHPAEPLHARDRTCNECMQVARQLRNFEPGNSAMPRCTRRPAARVRAGRRARQRVARQGVGDDVCVHVLVYRACTPESRGRPPSRLSTRDSKASGGVRAVHPKWRRCWPTAGDTEAGTRRRFLAISLREQPQQNSPSFVFCS